MYNEKSTNASLLRLRAYLLTILFLIGFAVTYWYTTIGIYSLIYDIDAKTGVAFLGYMLLGGACLIAIVTIGFTILFRLSLGWPIAMLIIGMLIVQLLTPVYALDRLQLMQTILADRYYGIQHRAMTFFLFAITQILGFILTALLSSENQSLNAQFKRNRPSGN